MRVVLVTGMSGSGKSVAIRLLEDIGYYCVDNLPGRFLNEVCGFLFSAGYKDLAVSIDARSEASLADLPDIIGGLRTFGYDVRVLFLTASTEALVQRYSETRRRHPLSQRLISQRQGTTRGSEQAAAAIPPTVAEPTLVECIEAERELLSPLDALGHTIDTGDLHPNTLRQWVREFVDSPRSTLTLAFESFAFKHGIPVAADLVFDVRNLPNPHYDLQLRPQTGLDEPVIAFLEAAPIVGQMIDDIAAFIDKWLPSYVADNRHYVTVAIGCTGGRHRSPYVVEKLARRFRNREHDVIARHRAISKP